MATDRSTFTFTNPTMSSAEFRLIGTFIANCLQSGGVIKTSDTGQIDWTTVTWSGSNAYHGYEIRRFSDTLQATKPVYLKIEYGQASNGRYLAIRLSVGTGSNGSGTLTGSIVSNVVFDFLVNSTTENAAISAGTGRFIFMGGHTGSSGTVYSGLISVERTHDGTGADTGDGLLLMCYGSSSSAFWRYIPFTGTLPASETGSGCPCFPPTQQTTALHSDGNVAVYPVYFYGIGETLYPSRNLVGAFVTDFTASNSYTVSVLGNNQVMLMSGGVASSSAAFARGAAPAFATFRGMMRYE